MFFSVVIPVYNKSEYIGTTIKSVLNQEFDDFELVIVNDGSTDNSIEQIHQFKDDRIKIIHQKNQGAAAARNKGIKFSNSNLIVFLDADDVWLPNHLKELKKLYIDFPDCGMYCNRYKIQISNHKSIGNNFSYSVENDFRGIVPDFFEASLINRIASSSSLMVPKKTLDKHGIFDTNITSGQDLDLWIRIAAYEHVALSDKTTAIYRFEVPNSLSKTPFLDKKLIDFKKYKSLEDSNKSLKRFLDIYRLEYAIQYRIANCKEESNTLLENISSQIPLTSKVLLKLPPKVLQTLLQIKHGLKKAGLNFNIYH